MLYALKMWLKGLLPPRLTRFMRYMGLDFVLEGRLQSTVYSGPFAGMRYVADSVGSAYYPKLLGTYELQLHPYIQRIVQSNCSAVIDVGAAEGYYAVGLARLLPKTPIVAYEMTARGRELIASMAAQNNAQAHLHILGTCDIASLQQTLTQYPAACIVMDVEGAEDVLLHPTQLQALAHCSILVELHPMEVKGIADSIRQRFAPTHHIEVITEQPRTLTDFPLTLPAWLVSLYRPLILRSMSENRAEPMQWFYMTPNV